MRNSIRPYRLASLRSKGEAQTLPAGGEAHGAEGLGAKATMGAGRWLETEGSEGGLREARRPAWVAKRAEEAAGPRPPAGVTALIVAMKPGNAGGAKGCRKMETQRLPRRRPGLRHRKRPTVMPEGASYGTARACAGIQTSARPIGRPPELGAEPRVWTARMLAALDKGVKACPRAGRRPDPWGGKWYSLIDKVYPEAALRAAFTQVAANRGAAGVDHVTIAKYASDLDANLARLSEALRTGWYRRRCERCWSRSHGSGLRPARGHASSGTLPPTVEPAPAQAGGFRPGRGCKDALRRVDRLLKAGYIHIVDADPCLRRGRL